MPVKTPSEIRERQIKSIPNITFVRWLDHRRNIRSKVVCRCWIDGFEWSVRVHDLLTGGQRCPQCSGRRKWTASERIGQINSIPNVEFVRWNGEFIGNKSKAVCRCTVDGHEWSSRVDNLLNHGHGCPQCSVSGYKTDLPGTLYALRSKCGAMIKIGISNDYTARHTTLKSTTPFEWDCVELIHGDGALISSLEKAFHGLTEPVVFKEPFDGYTEWRKWDNRIPEWFSNWREMVQCR